MTLQNPDSREGEMGKKTKQFNKLLRTIRAVTSHLLFHKKAEKIMEKKTIADHIWRKKII